MDDERKKPWWASRSNRMHLLGLLAVFGVAGAAVGLWLATRPGEDHRGATVALNEGQAAPDFSLPAAGGGTVSLDDFRGEKVLLYFSMGSG